MIEHNEQSEKKGTQPFKNVEANALNIETTFQNLHELHWNVIYWATVVILVLLLFTIALIKPFGPDQFIYLAKNLVQGRLSVNDMPLIYPDYVILDGNVYLPPGPLPAVVLIPFLPLLNLGLHPLWISILFTGLNVWLLSRIYIQIGIEHNVRKWSLLFFFGGTVYFGVAATMISWYFAHVLGTTCVLLAILSILGKSRRIFLAGMFLGLAVATRGSIVFSLPFFIWILLWGESPQEWAHDLSKKGLEILRLVIGIAPPLLLVLIYNYLRFGNPLETGHGIDVLGSAALEEARRFGLFGINHIPRNLVFMLFQGPLPYPSIESPIFKFPFLQPSPHGMGIFFTSPALIWVFFSNLQNRLVQACWLAVCFLLVPVTTYYASGWIQFGFRYSLDFMPFLMIIFAFSFPKSITNRARYLIVLSVLINLWGTAWLHTWV